MLVVGAEQMTTTPGPEIGKNLLKASYLPEDGDTPAGFAGVFGKIAQAYFQRHGDQSDALAAIAAKNHRNGVDNPYAQMRKDLGFDFCRQESDKNPFVAGPLKRTDCSLVSDGAAALVLADTASIAAADAARGRPSAPTSTSRTSCRCRSATSCCSRAASRPGSRRWRQAGVTLDDLSFVETHDCFTIAELIEYEAMGLAKRGRGRSHRAGGPDREGRPAAGQSLRRAEVQGPSDRRHGRFDARADGDAADGRSRRHPGAGRDARRHLQHGRRGGRQLRLDPRTGEIADSGASASRLPFGRQCGRRKRA